LSGELPQPWQRQMLKMLTMLKMEKPMIQMANVKHGI
jgi:hypothetical protein